MKKEETKVNFDLSVLRLDELVTLYEEVTSFLQYLDDKVIVEEEKVKKDE